MSFVVAPLAEVVAACRLTLERAPSGLLTDVDGTISPIAPTPDVATISREIRRALSQLASALDLVAIVSGRSAADARRLVGVEGLHYVGNHGLDELVAGRTRWHADVESYRPTLRRALTAMDGLTRELPGVVVEDKGPTLSIHYRQAPDQAMARNRILERARPFEGGLRLTEGKMVVELRAPLDVSKATAVRRLVEGRGLRGVVFLGDDLTDVGAFMALRGLREAPGPGAPRTFGVAVAGEESPEDVLRAADAVVGGVPDVADLLQSLADQLVGEVR